MTPTIESPWQDLRAVSSAAGVLKRLLDPDWIGELSATMVKPGNQAGILLELTEPIEVDADSLAGSKAVTVTTASTSKGVTKIQVTLTDPKYEELFGILCNDLVARILATETEEEGAQVLLKRLGRWLRFLTRRGSGALSEQRQMGLYGELTVLLDILTPVIGLRSAIDAWRGPIGAYQDFQVDQIAVEVKTLASTKPQQLRIETERQLDDSGLSALVLTHLAVDRRPGVGRTLHDAVEAIRVGIEGEDPAVEETFEELLFEAGYLDAHAHLYAKDGYTERDVHHYHVVPGFPRLTEEDLPAGVGAAQYRLDASACGPFEIERDRLATWLKDAPPPPDFVEHEESSNLEFKATAWKSIDNPNIPDKVINEAIVKTVAAMLNTDGGNLVIGVKDRTADIIGVEVDLDHLNTDRDGYENRLMTILMTALGQAVGNTRVKFEPREGGTICVISIRASTRPVFAKSPNAKGDKKIFWARFGNSSRELEGEELVNYIRDHWG